MEFTCPTCHIFLQAQKLGAIRLWKCESCEGFAVSLPIVRNGLQTIAFKKIWQQLFSGKFRRGRPCPGCKKSLSEVEAEGQSGVIEIDVCRTCQIVWFDDKEFSDLPGVEPKVESKVEQTKQSGSRLLTPEELTIAAFKADHHKNRAFLFKLMDGNISRKFELDSFFGDFFDE